MIDGERDDRDDTWKNNEDFAFLAINFVFDRLDNMLIFKRKMY